MKIYSCPPAVSAPQHDYRNYDRAKAMAAEAQHREALKTWLINHGYSGRHTGGVFREQVADGHAEYMLADGPKSFLIHLPYGDGYQSRNVEFLPKREVVRRIEAAEHFKRALRQAALARATELAVPGETSVSTTTTPTP